MEAKVLIAKYKRGERVFNNYGMNLREADLREANLHAVNLSEANLHGANLYGANLQEADLYGANLRGANLRGANLYGANLQEADLYGANLRGANLRGANLRGANLQEVNLSEANLSEANLSEANLLGANLHGADLGDQWIIQGPVRSDGYQFILMGLRDGVMLKAGCRYFTMAEAKKHWKRTRGGTPLGKETFAILASLEAIAKARKLKLTTPRRKK